MSGQKTLAMFLYEYAYNHYKDEVSKFDKELAILKTAVRLESANIENSIKAMDEEFAAIDQLCQHLQDEYADEDTKQFRNYMRRFLVDEGSKMKMLSIKFRGAQTMAANVARFYGIELEENKPENLFKRVQEFVDIMDKSRRKLIKLEKERQKKAAKRAKDREKLKKQKAKAVKKRGGQVDGHKTEKKFSVAEAVQRKRMEENERKDKGNLLFHDIQKEAGRRQQLQNSLEIRLTMHFKEVRALAKGQELPSMRKDSIKHRVTMAANAGFAPLKLIAQDEAAALDEEEEGSYSSESDLDDEEYTMM